MLRQQGHLLTWNGDVVGRWMEPCEDFLNQANMSSWKKTKYEDLGGKTHSDTWQSSLISSPMAACQAWLTLRCLRLWTVTPFHYRVEAWDRACRVVDWCGGSHFNKGDRRLCSSYKGIRLLSFPGNVYSSANCQILDSGKAARFSPWPPNGGPALYPPCACWGQLGTLPIWSRYAL